jgi:hypothetical protein
MRFTIRNTRKGITYLSLPVGGIIIFGIGVLIGMFFKTCSEWLR